MALGPGRYGANAEALLKQVGGDLCIVIVLGAKGSAFDVATADPTLLVTLPDILRRVADDIDKDMKGEGN